MSDAQSQAIGIYGTNVEALVARYAPIGRQLRRRRKLARIAFALLIPIAGIAAVLIWQSRGLIAEQVGSASDANRTDRALVEVRDLKASLEAEKGAIRAQRAELTRQQTVFSKKNDELAAQLVAVNAQRKTLAEQSRQFDEQQALLARGLEKADRQRRSLQASTGSQSSIDRQLLEIEQQKRLLQAQKQRFLDQGQRLARELGEIDQQRGEIERQRQAIEAQQAEVRKLLEQVNPVGANRQRQDQKSETARASDPLTADAGLPEDLPDEVVGGAIATMAAVEPGVLGQMHGGIDVGQDFSFGIGISRTTSINGVEQFSSAMYINELGNATGMGGSTQTLQLGQPIIIQNGSGNVVDAATLANMNLNYGTIIQNTLDNQTITNKMVLDVSLQNVSSLIQNIDASRIAREGLSLPK